MECVRSVAWRRSHNIQGSREMLFLCVIHLMDVMKCIRVPVTEGIKTDDVADRLIAFKKTIHVLVGAAFPFLRRENLRRLLLLCHIKQSRRDKQERNSHDGKDYKRHDTQEKKLIIK